MVDITHQSTAISTQSRKRKEHNSVNFLKSDINRSVEHRCPFLLLKYVGLESAQLLLDYAQDLPNLLVNGCITCGACVVVH